MRGSSKQLAVMQDMAVESNKTLINVFLNAVDAGHVEGAPVLARPVPLFIRYPLHHARQQVSCLEVAEDYIELTDGTANAATV